MPKGWQFSGEPSSLTLSNSNFDVYFLIFFLERLNQLCGVFRYQHFIWINGE